MSDAATELAAISGRRYLPISALCPAGVAAVLAALALFLHRRRQRTVPLAEQRAPEGLEEGKPEGGAPQRCIEAELSRL